MKNIEIDYKYFVKLYNFIDFLGNLLFINSIFFIKIT